MQRNQPPLGIVKALVILSLGIFLADCPALLNTPEKLYLNETGRVLVRLSDETDGARTLLPQTQLTQYELTFTASGQDALEVPSISKTVAGAADVTVDLAGGTWIITVKATVTVNGVDYEAFKGTETLLVEAGKEHSVTIVLNKAAGNAKGTLSYSISFPDGLTEAAMKITSLSDSSSVYTVNLLPDNNTGSIKLSSGYYLVTLLLKDNRLDAGKTEVAHIFPNMETELHSVFTEDDFTAGMYLAGTIQAPAGYHGERVAVYSDSTCLDQITETSVTDAAWSVVIPAFYTTVYFRVELAKGELRIWSKPESRTVAVAGYEDIVLTATLYTVAVEQSADGAIATDLVEATEGTVVTVIAEGNASYRLKANSLKAVYGTVTVPVVPDSESSAVYSFIMPSGNVTVNGTFVPMSPELKDLSVKHRNGVELLQDFSANTSNYTVFVIDTVPLITIDFTPLYPEDQVRYYNAVLQSGNTITFSFGENTLALTAIAMDEKTHTEYTATYTLKIIVSDIPVMSIDTGGRAISSTTLWVEGASYALYDKHGGVTSGATDIKGRGNATWDRYPKKPYSLKLTNKTSLLDMPEHKRWALLANYFDKTLLRSETVFKMGTIFDNLAWTSCSRQIVLYQNNYYRGVYQLTEAIKIDTNRLNINEIKKNNPNGGYILEIDNLLHNGSFKITTTKGIIFSCSDPDENLDDVIIGDTKTLLEKMQADIQQAEDALYAANFIDPDEGYRKYFDVDSLVDYFLVVELIKDYEILNRNGRYMYYDPGKQKYCMGPLWDYDASLGNSTGVNNYHTTYNFIAKNFGGWARLFQDPYFVAKVKARWNNRKQAVIALDTYVEDRAVVLNNAQRLNFQKWNILNVPVWPNQAEVAGSYQGEIDYLRSWLTERIAWLDTAINNL
jgi:hypothetical protein